MGSGVKGIMLTNIIDHNNFANTIMNGYDIASDIWDNGSVGNYWNDYTGIDANHDGIGDTPYNISGGSSQDHYPLMLPLDSTPPVIANIQATPSCTRTECFGEHHLHGHG